eukprot:1476796-Rhodomonas_salina.2
MSRDVDAAAAASRDAAREKAEATEEVKEVKERQTPAIAQRQEQESHAGLSEGSTDLSECSRARIQWLCQQVEMLMARNQALEAAIRAEKAGPDRGQASDDAKQPDAKQTQVSDSERQVLDPVPTRAAE